MNHAASKGEPDEEGASASMADKAPLAVPTEFTSRRLVTIQSLRGIAALMVVFHHALHQSPGFLALWPTEAGQAGVDLFFVISGFVMVYVTQERERSAGQFLAMRAARIVPVYWFYTLAAVLLMYLVPQLFRSNELSLRHVLLSLLFIPHQSAEGSLSPVIKQGWTLNYEVFFYILFAIAMAISARYRVRLSVSVLVVVAALGYWAHFAGVTLGTPGFYFNNILLEFVFGMLIAKAYFYGKLQFVRPSVGATLIVIGFFAFFALDPFFTYANRVLVYGIPAVIIVIGALAFEARERPLRIPLIQFTGDASYSIYLVHIFPMAILRSTWSSLSLPLHGVFSFAAFLALSAFAAIGFGSISYHLVERTSLKYFRNAIQRYSR